MLLANTLVALVVLSLASSYRLLPRSLPGITTVASLPLLIAVLLTAFVFGEDTYRDNGISRWDAYRSPGGALGPMFVLSVVLLVACAALLVFFALTRRWGLMRSTLVLAGLLGLFLVTPTIIGFSTN